LQAGRKAVMAAIFVTWYWIHFSLEETKVMGVGTLVPKGFTRIGLRLGT
jgi:hypothetical protein